MILTSGTQDKLIAEVTTGAGSTVREISIQTDAILVTLWADYVNSGTLDVIVYTLTDTGKESKLFAFPQISGGTTSLLLKKSSISMQRIRVQINYSGICSYEIYCRAISTIGEASFKILGNGDWAVQQIDVTTTPTTLLPISLIDRQGVVVKNWGGGNLFIAESTAKLLAGKGYPLAPGDGFAMDVAGGTGLFGMSGGGTVDVRIVEAGG